MSEFLINGIPFPSPVIKTRPDEVKAATLGNQSNGTSFGDVLENAIQQVSNLQQEAGSESQKLLTGNTQDIHSAMVALQKADVSFQMMMQVRNKLVSAYQEIMKTQV
jgi:flagellar hook-basal body complex protein FliE